MCRAIAFGSVRVSRSPYEMGPKCEGFNPVFSISPEDFSFGLCLGSSIMAEPVAAVWQRLVSSTKGLS